MQRVYKILFLLLFLGVSAKADRNIAFLIDTECRSHHACLARPSHFMNYMAIQCKTDVDAQKCEDLEKAHPEWAGKMRRCDLTSVCQQNSEYFKNKNLACLRGYKNAAVDMGLSLKDLVVELDGFLFAGWESAKKDVKNRNRFIAECSKSLACKRDLAKDNPRLRDMSDEALRKISAGAIFVANDDMKYMNATLERMKHRPDDSMFRAPPDNAKEPSEDFEDKKQILLKLLKENFQVLSNRYACFDPLAREELECYALGSVIDPTMFLGKTGKAAQLASDARIAMGTEEIAKMNFRSRSEDFSKTTAKEKRSGAGGNILEDFKVSPAKPPPSIANLPSSLKLEQMPKVDGGSFLQYSYVEKLPDGTWVRMQRDLPMDEISGGINANYPTGREFFEKMAAAKAGKAHVAFLDVGSLGAVNKKFKGGEAAGDRYLKAVAEEIIKNGEGKVTMARLGGDEFGLIIDSADPKKVQSILANIQTAIRKNLNGDAHQVFREEKVARAEKYRADENALKTKSPDGQVTAEEKKNLRQDIDELAKIQQPDVSIGSTQIGQGENLSSLLERAEEQAKDMKIQTTLNFGRSAEKYGSTTAPRNRPNPNYMAEVKAPTPSDTWGADVTKQVPDIDSVRAMQIQRKEELSRFGSTTLARYEDEAGRSSYRIEKYLVDATNGKRTRASSEISTRGSTGLLDGMCEDGQKLLMDHFKSKTDSVLVMPKLKSLRTLNYFESGTKAGDEMLKAVAATIKSSTRSQDLTFKLNGADFLWSLHGASPSDITKMTRKINSELEKSPKVKEILNNERLVITRKLEAAKSQGNAVAVTRLSQKLEDLKNYKPDLQFQTLTRDEIKDGSTFQDVIKNFDEKFKD